MPSDSHFRLFDLPDEIWVKIAKYAVDLSPKPKQNQAASCSPDLVRQPAITRACHKLRAELLPYFYGHHVKLFLCCNFHGLCLWSGRTRVWLRAIGPSNLESIRSIRLFVREAKLEEAVRRIRKDIACTLVVGEQLTELDENAQSFVRGEEKVYPLRFV
ncbi:hypothetical protein LTR56_001414 [Elasticomyces elasticus]|nr:hypothetical protein LTR56_001414 [Elasticomyces elasticus]KAK3668664.1 hypothetical protein LTR22_000551 [Elasticomyces elasticus]KAK4932016.1 hypothetical protein LTR49_001703 [Elasticomyces elasticus]KAK5768454.1 hypothetical protein LTS12_001242 [Elasticomyces elasticus]